MILRAIIRHHTVNLVALATTADGNTCSNKSRYRRFQDFFLRFSRCMPSVAKIILNRIPTQKDGYLLAMDRTNGQFGRKKFQLPCDFFYRRKRSTRDRSKKMRGD
ncbi:MAG: hypothetical protein QNL68_13620 [Akkermansiaceae bacterium]